MKEEETERKKKEETSSESGEVYKQSKEVSATDNQSEQPAYLGEIILETVKEKISQSNNARLPPVKDMKKLMGIYDTLETMVESRKQKPANTEKITSSEE